MYPQVKSNTGVTPRQENSEIGKEVLQELYGVPTMVNASTMVKALTAAKAPTMVKEESMAIYNIIIGTNQQVGWLQPANRLVGCNQPTG